jgi:hypothetical protein
MTNNDINRLIDKLNQSNDNIEEQLEVSVEIIGMLLVKVHHLQSFAIEHGLDGEDFANYMDEFDNRTIH